MSDDLRYPDLGASHPYNNNKTVATILSKRENQKREGGTE